MYVQNPIASTEKEKWYKDLSCIVLLYSHKQTGEIKAKLFSNETENRTVGVGRFGDHSNEMRSQQGRPSDKQ